MANDSQHQVYDNILKRLLEDHASEIIPRLLAEENIEIIEELNIEVLIPPRRNDRVYKVWYKGQIHVLDFEIEVASNTQMHVRLLIYHALLLEKYRLPVLSVIIYPFKVAMVESPLSEMSGDEELLRFFFRTLPLWKLDGQKYFAEHDICMYALLPAMSGISAEMHAQALEQMIQYYQDDEDELRNQLLCFGIMLRRARILPAVDLVQIEERLNVYDRLIAEDPHIQAMVASASASAAAEAVAEAVAEAKIEAEAKAVAAFQKTLLDVIQARFPLLSEKVRRQGVLLNKRDALDLLIVQVAVAPNEEVVCQILGIPTI